MCIFHSFKIYFEIPGISCICCALHIKLLVFMYLRRLYILTQTVINNLLTFFSFQDTTCITYLLRLLFYDFPSLEVWKWLCQ